MKRLTLLAAVLGILLMGGCATEQELRDRAYASAETKRSGPQKPVVRNITNFTPALRCMDRNMSMYGIRDMVIISEDIEDKTKKVSAGAKDMLISAVSTMSQRSKAIRLIAYGNDSGNLIGFMNQRENKSLYQLNPQFGIRGSISQFDDNVAKESQGSGLLWELFGGIGVAKDASVSMLGLDLTVMNTQDLTVVPGVTSNNVVGILRSSSGKNVDLTIRKFGANYETNLGQAEGTAQALRNLVDLAAIELFGKLTRTPYWTCLGGPPDSPDIKAEIDNWYYSLFSDQGQFVAYWQNQMRLRGVYGGEVNGVPDIGLRHAIEAYRQALGLEKNAQLNQEFFAAYLNADHYAIAPKAQELLAGAAGSAPGSTRGQARQVQGQAAAGPTPLQINVRAANGARYFKPGESIVLKVAPNRNAYVYCYMQNENQSVVRFFPNRFSRNALVPARGISLPQGDEFSINASLNGAKETIACFATERDVAANLPGGADTRDFEALPVNSLGEVAAVFKRLNGVAATLPITYKQGS